MQIDLVSMCLFAIIVIAVLMLMSRMMAGRGVDYSQRGSGRPEYDDPNISSRGGFGGDSGGERPRYDDPNIDSRGGFGRNRDESLDRESHNYGSDTKPPLKGGGRSGFFGGRSSGGSSPRRDSPSVSSRGGFGRNKR
jgi:hypothetical protein